MCGIAGVINLQHGPLEDAPLADVVSRLAARGPDGRGIARVTEQVAFGHTRLAIIDCSSNAAQPMEISGHWLTYNGELYNFKELRDQYLSGEDFFSKSDTEVLLRLLIKQGLSIINQLDGFFAFAYCDGQSVFLVTDFYGKKPLYYRKHEGQLWFASEINALQAVTSTYSLRPALLDMLSAYRYADSWSPFQEVEILPAGSILKIGLASGDLEISRHYDLSKEIRPERLLEFAMRSSQSLEEELEELLKAAVKKRLLADVPVGIVASGGLDSSLVAALACQVNKFPLLHVDVAGLSETDFAGMLARHLGVELHVLKLDQEYFEKHYEAALQAYEFPMIHPNGVGILAVAELSRSRNIPVLLGGEGADELLGGYPQHKRYYLLSRLLQIFGARSAKTIARVMRLAVRLKKYNKNQPTKADHQVAKQIYLFQDKYENSQMGAYQGFLAHDLITYLSGLLLRADKLSMAHAVEMRMPFLDRQLVEFCLHLPAEQRNDKAILKRIAARYLPPAIVQRKKQGFPVPPQFYLKSKIYGGRAETDFILKSAEQLLELFRDQKIEQR